MFNYHCCYLWQFIRLLYELGSFIYSIYSPKRYVKRVGDNFIIALQFIMRYFEIQQNNLWLNTICQINEIIM